MKKTFYACLIAAATLCGVVSSCSEEEVFLPQVTEQTVFADANLALTYGEEVMVGKQVKFIPNATDNNKATIELTGKSLSMPTKAEAAGFATPGVVPGETTTTINVTLVNNEKESTFAGEDKAEGRTIKYSGKVTKEKLELNLNVVLNNAFAGKSYDLLPYVEAGNKQSNPITLDWSSTAKVPFLFGGTTEMNEILKMVGGTGFIPLTPDATEKLNISEALALVLKQVSFLPDGNIVAQYKDAFTDTEWKTSPKNLATYSVAKDGKIRLYLNVEGIIAAATPQAKTRLGVADLLPVLMKHGARMLSEGITITYKDNKGISEFYLDQETVFKVLEDLVPFFNDKDFVAEVKNLVIGMLPEGEESEALKPIIEEVITNVISSIPTVMENTTNLHFGINTTLAE